MAFGRLHFNFLHGHGLGVVGLGHNYSNALRFFFDANEDSRLVNLVREIFASLGRSARLFCERSLFDQTLAERAAKIAALDQALAERDRELGGLRDALAERDEKIISLGERISEIYSSHSWQITKPMRFVAQLLRVRPDALSAAVFSAGTRPSRAALHARVSAPHALGLALGAPAGGGFAGDQHAIAELHLGGPAACGLELEIEPLADTEQRRHLPGLAATAIGLPRFGRSAPTNDWVYAGPVHDAAVADGGRQVWPPLMPMNSLSPLMGCC